MMYPASKSATPEFSMALLMAKAQAMVIRISHEIYLVYFCGGNILLHAIITVVMDTKKNISSLMPSGRYFSMPGSSPTVAPTIMNRSRKRVNQRFFLPAGSYSFPLASIRKTDDSPHVWMKLSSVSTTSVSPSRKLTSLRFL